MLTVVLALGTSVSYGVSNFLGPLLARRHSLAAVLLVGQVAALLGAIALVVAVGDAPPDAEAVGIGVLAGTGNVVGLAAFYRAAQLGPVSVAATIGATGTVLPVAFGVLTGDELSIVQVAGIALAITGAALTARRKVTGDERPVTPAAVLYAVLSGVGLGVLLIALPEAADDGLAWALLDARIAVVVLLAGGIAVLRAPVGVPARALPQLSVPGLLLLLGTLLYAEATRHGLISIASVLASLATVVTVGLSFALLGERLAPVQRAGVVFAVGGVVMLAA